MSDAIAALKAILTLDNSDYLAKLNESADKGNSIMSGLSKVGGVAAAGVAAGLVGATAAGIDLLTNAAEAASDAQQVETKLNSTLANTSSITGVTADMVEKLSTKYSSLTTYQKDTEMAAGEVLARFKEINSGVFPDALKLSNDLATRLGIDVPGAADLLGKALADPGVGLKRLKDAGVILDDQQQTMIKTMMDSGDVAGAQAVLMDIVTKAVGGSAEAMGNTAAGIGDRLKNMGTDVLETLGAGILPVLTALGQTLLEYFNRPEVQAFIAGLAQNIATFGTQVITWIPVAIQWIQMAFGWLMDNQGLIVAGLAAIGVAIMAWAITTAIAAWTALVPLLPVIAVLLLIAAAGYLLYEAWINDWGGIQEKAAAVWAFLQPIFQGIWTWLSTNIPIAIKALADFWTNVLMPPLKAAWTWIQTYLFPLFQQLGQLLGHELKDSFSGLAGLWHDVLYPVLQAWWSFLGTYLVPILKVVIDIVGDGLKVAFMSLSGAISLVTDGLKLLNGFFSKMEVPKDLKPGSPTPFEMGLRGIGEAMTTLSRSQLPTFQAALQLNPEPVLASASLALTPRAVPVSAETPSSQAQAASNDALLKELRQLMRDLPDAIAKASRNAAVRTST